MNRLKAFEECESIIKLHSKTFHRAFSLLPKNQRNAVWAIYAFCRTVDDIVDESDHPEEDLLEFEEEFKLFLSGDIDSNSPQWVALHDVFCSYEMNTQAFIDMIKGQRMDIEDRRYESLEDVLDYSYHVASTVGLMLLPVLAPKNQTQLMDGAVQLGYAMQLTNILRDIGEDFERGRVYIPKELMDKHGYTYEMLANHDNGPAFQLIWEEMAVLAEMYYERALATINLYPLYSRPPVKGAAVLYRAILDEIRKNNYNVFTAKNYVSSKKKEKILSSHFN
ncbi:phytoene/squalene synthase family protein [Jeotgalibacillus sp. S-D1]|uniref:phytoene/squalene synthase family protein n=1 Tax=Jeotgalibacillus sp. S-D1 TaxID=2552189 RepID=UPI0010593207|nr:phytoene/squalene synthase family protein [Jeotgalibacillus sp. S-D1]TDL35346.1 phytoene/squalene synthase family protein [Jeotgalibacillus sp. S-D1]